MSDWCVQTTVMFPGGTVHRTWQHEHENVPEYQGRLLCWIEDSLSGKRLTPPAPGTRWVEWEITGHQLGKPHMNGLGVCYEHTGEKYQNRRRVVRSMLNEQEARRLLGGG